MREIEKYYREVELPKVRKAISNFKQEQGISGQIDRWLYLQDRLITRQGQIDRTYLDIRDSYRQDGTYIDRGLRGEGLQDLEAERDKISREISHIEKIISGGKDSRDDFREKIERAKEYPIESLLDVRRGMALCPFHGDKSPSLGIKNNRYNCFACGAKGSVIDFVMKMDGISFKEAVNYLAR
jgi:hypothetical protein